MEKRCSFELFKSNVCHWLKEEGDIDFLIQVLESDLIRKYYNRKWYLESFYYIRSFGGDRKGVGKASPQYQKDSMSF